MKYFLLLFSFTFLLSCSSDDDSGNTGGDDDQGNIQETLLLKKVFRNNELLWSYEYFDDNKLKSEYGLLVDDDVFEMHYEYIADTIVESFYRINETAPIAIYKSYEINNTTSRKDYYDQNNDFNLYRYDIFTFDNNLCGAELLTGYDDDGTYLYSISYSYTDENCSVDTILNSFAYQNDSGLNDDKKAAFESITSSLKRQETLHNRLEYRVWGNNDTLSTSNSYNSVFEYNSDDYPTKETRTNLNGDITVLTFEYY